MLDRYEMLVILKKLSAKIHLRKIEMLDRCEMFVSCVSKEPKYRSLDGEATECRLCEHCGCMLNTDYI